MSLHKKSVLKDVTCLIIIFIRITKALGQSYTEDFESGTLGMMTTACEKGSLFDVKKYEDYAHIFSKPDGANDYFITPGKDDFSCVETGQPLKVLVGTELKLSVFTSNPGGMIFAFWMMTDSETGSLIWSTPIFIDNTKKWRSYSFTAPRNGSVHINLQCEELSNKNAFWAIDHMTVKEIGKPDEDTTPSWSTTIDYSNPTTLSESTTTNPELTTPSTIPTPEPPSSSITCNCNCNCNFQCNSNA